MIKRQNWIAKKKLGAPVQETLPKILDKVRNELRLTESMQNYKEEPYRLATGIISLGFIKQLFEQPDILKRSLGADLEKCREPACVVDHVDIGELEKYVRTQAPKLYAVLQLAGEPQVIVRLYICNGDHPVTDAVFEQSESKSDNPYCSLTYLEGQAEMKCHAAAIYKYHWYIPPKLRHGTDPTYLVDSFRFPFSKAPIPIGSGAQGQVFRARIAPLHLYSLVSPLVSCLSPVMFVGFRTEQT
jgi:hypothetical protein